MAKMFEYGLQYMDWLVFTWVTRITAINDTLDSFHVAWSSVSERYLPLSFWHFFFLQENGDIPCLAMSRDEQIQDKNLPDD